MSKLRQLKAGMIARWRKLPLSDRRRCMLVSVLTPLALLIAYDARPRPDAFEALASGLTSTEASAVRGHLDDRHVPYVLLDGGQTVMVPAGQRAELTIELTRLALVRSVLYHAPRTPRLAVTDRARLPQSVKGSGGD
ncbi:MAG: hypothetical protein SGI88_16820 [Candidatus Hydrogenedentes bacterium]|nr:hypothetical protein [Candidatus Hydrogenedentota bacterium]